MLRRRETPHPEYATQELPRQRVSTLSSSSSSSHHNTPLPFIRNHSVATSNPTFHENAHVIRSYFHRASRASSSSISSLTSKARSTAVWIYYIPAILLFVLPWLSPHALNEDIHRSQSQIRIVKKKQMNLVQEIDAMTLKIQNYNSKIHAMEKENKKQFDELRRSGDIVSRLNFDSERYQEMERTEEGVFARLDILERHIQKMHAKQVLTKYGPGPHRVKVQVEDVRLQVSSFVMELAPTSEMPHAVYHFLQMVEQNLWNGLSMMLNGGGATATDEGPLSRHWMVTPMRMDLRHGQHSWESQRFEDANLTHMVFTEHSATYPPPGKWQYSVAFSGHPGGPSFYVRLDDDSEEEHVSDIHQQTSTFATVVEGIDVLTRYLTTTEASNRRNKPGAKPKKKQQSGNNSLKMLTIRSMELLGDTNQEEHAVLTSTVESSRVE